jgi:hypothetical protein
MPIVSAPHALLLIADTRVGAGAIKTPPAFLRSKIVTSFARDLQEYLFLLRNS